MKCASGIVALALSVFLGGSAAWAQKTPAEIRQARQDILANPSVDNIRTYYLKSTAQASDANELYTALRNMLPADVKSYLVPSQNAIIVCATSDQFAIVDKLLSDLDHPRKTYRLTYTVTDMDGARRVGSQRFAMVVASGQQATLKQGSKVPVATGTYNATASTGPNAAPAGMQTNFTYLDVGMNFDATPTSVGDGISLKTSVEQLSIADEKSGVGPQDPIVKQTSLKSTLLVPPGKPVMLGSIDLPGTTHRLDIEVTAEQLP
jgi:type II secretory pathway component GspD/PulD (secretin)